MTEWMRRSQFFLAAHQPPPRKCFQAVVLETPPRRFIPSRPLTVKKNLLSETDEGEAFGFRFGERGYTLWVLG